MLRTEMREHGMNNSAGLESFAVVTVGGGEEALVVAPSLVG